MAGTRERPYGNDGRSDGICGRRTGRPRREMGSLGRFCRPNGRLGV